MNNASPVAVVAIAATGAEIAIDFLADRLAYAGEVIEVYRGLEQVSFDKLGRIAP